MKNYKPEHLDLFIRSCIENIYNDDMKNVNNEADLKNIMHYYLYPMLKNSNYKMRTEYIPKNFGQQKIDLSILDKKENIIAALEFKYSYIDTPEVQKRIQNDETKLLKIIKRNPKSLCYAIWFDVDVNYKLDKRIELIEK